MKIIDKKTIITVIITLLVLTGVFLFDNKSYAMPSNVPEITSFEKSTIENNALKVTIKSNNTGSDYSYELINVTTGKTKNLAGSTTSYTYQGLESGKEYEVMIKACDNKEKGYSCTSWSPSKKATVGNNSDQIQDSIVGTSSYQKKIDSEPFDLNLKTNSGNKLYYKSSNSNICKERMHRNVYLKVLQLR